MNYSPEHRLAVYEKYKELELMRDDCILDEITLHSLVGDYEKAISIAAAKRFHIYEGGEGKLTKQHAWMHVLYGNRLAKEGQLDKAVEIYTRGINMPKSYGEAKTFFNQEAHIYYYMGLVTEALGKDSRECFENAAVYKAAVSEISLFRALALRKLYRFTEAREVLDEMLACSDNFINNSDRRTYYGVGSPSPMPFELDIVKNNLTEGYILRAYALLGLGRFDEAQSFISKVKGLSPYDFRVYAFGLIKDGLKN